MTDFEAQIYSRLLVKTGRRERNFRHIKQFRRVFTRYDKWDETYDAFIPIANIILFLRS